MITIVLCVHYHEAERHFCAAFPQGIPDEIESGRHDHRLPYRGNHGVRFELVQGVLPSVLPQN